MTVAGRVMLLRDQGKLAFGVLREGDGAEIQLFCGAKWTERFVELTSLQPR